MRESNIEGVASRGGPEPCVVVREGGGEASVGYVQAGLLSLVIFCSGCRRGPTTRKATSLAAFSRAVDGLRGVEEPGHVRNLRMREPGDPMIIRLS